MSGRNCRKCSRVSAALKKTKSTSDFILEAVTVHGNEYDYSKSNYAGSLDKIEIICKKHGSFYQLASSHLAGRGCDDCRGSKISASKLSNIDDFIKKANRIHGGLYDYSKSSYIGNKQNLIITCNLHGDFYQKPDHHLSGNGCQLCGMVKSGPGKTTIYLTYFRNLNLFKIGATNDIDVRLITLSREVGEEPILLNYKVFDKDHIVYLVEKNLLDHMRKAYVQCTDSFCGHTECFEVPSEKLHEAEKYIYDFMSSGNHLNKLTVPFEGGCNVSN